ncbi:glycosyltransferase family 39 protein [Flavobacterium beibuense]|uniref:Glycosyl transferase family 39 n=1 Tax=Flavobacterium beibuense TaxID=657326 RepID=A0A444WDR6_9FLAO|nr:glycosyltransferase family 39 protein [Flavobacterium beibuense]RYJ43916.1 Glycosyl transferase family 39 [Flavobacterium beibuense]
MKKTVTFIKQNYILLGILLLASFLRIFHADFQSIWLDEIHTMIESDPSLSLKEFHEVILAREGMGHLYFFIVRIFHILFGYSALTARIFSVLTGIATIYAIYLLGKSLYNKNTGLIAALLLTINLYHISYSQEARPYALLVLFCVLSFYRLLLFLREPSSKNAIWYGIFTGLMVNAHFVSLITVVGQALLILFMLVLIPKKEKGSFFKFSVLSGIVTLIVILPTYEIFLKMTQYHSGWLTLPGPNGFSEIVRGFTGNTELLWFPFLLLAIFYFVTLFTQKQKIATAENLLSDKIIFSSLFLFCWIFFSIPITIIKSYLDEPMILSRYYIHLLPALIVLFALAVSFIRNSIGKGIIILIITILSLTDIFIVKDYYNKVYKSQYRELTIEIQNNNQQGDKVVSSWGWLMSYFFKSTGEPVLEMKLGDYIEAMKNGKIEIESFWFLDGNFNMYNLTTEQEAFLNENFTLSKNIQMYDAWARHYKSKKSPEFPLRLSSDRFIPKNIDDKGNLYIFENGSLTSGKVKLQKGQYNLVIKANSLPKEPINGEHAHLQVKMGDEKIGDYYLGGDENTNEKKLPFEIKADTKTKAQFIFDNDTFADGKDRNLIIYSVQIEKKE